MRKTKLAEKSSYKRRVRQTKAPRYRQMRRRRGAILCFDVDGDPGLEFHGEVVGEDGDLFDEFFYQSLIKTCDVGFLSGWCSSASQCRKSHTRAGWPASENSSKAVRMNSQLQRQWSGAIRACRICGQLWSTGYTGQGAQSNFRASACLPAARRDPDRPLPMYKTHRSPYSLYCNQQDNELQYNKQEVQSYERFNGKRTC